MKCALCENESHANISVEINGDGEEWEGLTDSGAFRACAAHADLLREALNK